VAELIGVPYETVTEKLLKGGELGYVKAGRHYIIPDAELQAWLARGATPAVRRVSA
jgi:excisionase family DNA binding protein